LASVPCVIIHVVTLIRKIIQKTLHVLLALSFGFHTSGRVV
jgi:hypothetical protein